MRRRDAPPALGCRLHALAARGRKPGLHQGDHVIDRDDMRQ